MAGNTGDFSQSNVPSFSWFESTSLLNTQQQKLFTIVAKGDRLEAEAMINQGMDPKMVGKGGMTLLHCACKQGGDLDLVKYLVDGKGLDIDATTMDSVGSDPRQPVHFAAESNFVPIVKYLLRKGCKQLSPTEQGIVHYACLHKDHVQAIRSVQFYIDKVKLDYTSPDIWGYLPVANAVRAGNVNLARYLFNQKGINPKHRSDSQRTVLHEAIVSFKGDLSMVMFLVEGMELDINARDENGRQPMHEIAMVDEKYREKILEYFVLTCNADINSADNFGFRLLNFMISEGQATFIRQMVCDFGARVDIVSAGNVTALQQAYDENQFAIANFIKGCLNGQYNVPYSVYEAMRKDKEEKAKQEALQREATELFGSSLPAPNSKDFTGHQPGGSGL